MRWRQVGQVHLGGCCCCCCCCCCLRTRRLLLRLRRLRPEGALSMIIAGNLGTSLFRFLPPLPLERSPSSSEAAFLLATPPPPLPFSPSFTVSACLFRTGSDDGSQVASRICRSPRLHSVEFLGPNDRRVTLSTFRPPPHIPLFRRRSNVTSGPERKNRGFESLSRFENRSAKRTRQSCQKTYRQHTVPVIPRSPFALTRGKKW